MTPDFTTPTRRRLDERGIALITTLLVLMLISTLLIGFTTIVMTDARFRFIDKDRGQAFYAASGAIEKLTADLGNTFMKNVAPTNAQLTGLTALASQPAIPGVSYTASSAPAPLPASELASFHCNNSDGINRAPMTVGGNGYTISFCGLTASNNPTTTPDPKVITSGTYEGLLALKTPYQLDVTAKSATGGEVHLVRSIEAVSIPIFQFGIFSDVDLAFNAGDAFSFGGRVHTNGNLFLAEAAGNTLTLADKVTAFKEVIRTRLSNGVAVTVSGHTGTVNMAKAPGSYRALASTEGSLVDGPGSALNEPTWTSISLGTYKGYIKNGRTGAKQLNLPLLTAGGVNTDLVRRPPQGEDPNSIVFQERLFNKVSLRVMLSDTAGDINNIPGVDLTIAPVSLEAPNTYGGTQVASSPGPLAANPAVNAAVAAGANKTLTFAAALPAFLRLPATISAVSGLNTWNIAGCTAKTPTTFTGCTVTTTAGAVATIPVGATITAPGVNAVALTAASNPAGNGANRTITVANGNTMGFSMNTFWMSDQVITCSGLTATTLTGCTLAANVANGDTIQNFATMNAGTSLLGGFIKIERQNANDSTWHDITAEILGYGFGAPSQTGSCTATDPSPNAILRLQRYADDAWVAPCLKTLIAASATNYWPNTLFDTRESVQRDAAPASGKLKLNGVLHYVSIDAGNLAKWFKAQAPYAAGTGAQSKPDNAGYSIYISDRRNNRDATSTETAEYGWEDFVNPASATGAPNALLDPGEDLNANTQLDVYGGVPNCNGAYNTLVSGGVTCAATWFTVAANNKPTSDLALGAEAFTGIGRAMVNRPILFRRAIKLINGSTLGAIVTGLTTVTENPVYVKGDWNANGAFNDPHAATAVIGDAVTLLSNAWVDNNSFLSPYDPNGRPRSANSYYRMAVLAGKGAIFAQPAGTGSTFGTDGGAHVFLRFLEGTGAAPDTIHYRGSLATFYYNRQGTGVFKGNGTVVYAIPSNRDYLFDTDFLTPPLLPPLTPVFRDMNAVGFSQELRPGK